MNEEHLAKVNSNSKSKEKIQLSKWREQACFWRQNSSYHRKWREQTCFSMFSRWRQISNSDRMRNICRNGARSEADLAQCGSLALPPPFLFFVAVGANFFFNALLCRLVVVVVHSSMNFKSVRKAYKYGSNFCMQLSES